MTDEKLIALYWQRTEEAIAASRKKYGAYCFAIAKGILGNTEDADEILNDVFFKAWEQIPPYRPQGLQAFFARLTRQLSINQLERSTAQKRGGGEYALALDELQEVVGKDENLTDRLALQAALETFLRSLKADQRVLFVERYWYLLPLKELAQKHRMSESAVKMRLSRLRQQLQQRLQKEGLL